jgi:hypothetical protein
MSTLKTTKRDLMTIFFSDTNLGYLGISLLTLTIRQKQGDVQSRVQNNPTSHVHPYERL